MTETVTDYLTESVFSLRLFFVKLETISTNMKALPT